jgi:hypothetical protein
MHLHEIHHKALNDDTGWGAAIHIADSHPEWKVRLAPLLVDSCRIVHESFASFMSISLAGARHEHADSVLDQYPIYLPLARRLTRLLTPLADSHRRDLAATGIARFCMNSPILDLLVDSYPREISLSDIPTAWLPDHRFTLIASAPADVVAAAGSEADRAFQQHHGHPINTLTLDLTDEALDSAWQSWEERFVAALTENQARLSRLPAITANSHLQAAAALVAAASVDGLSIEPPHKPGEHPLSDLESVQRILTATRIPLRDPYKSGLVTPGEGVDLAEILDHCAVHEPPYVVVQGRTAKSLLANFEFSPADHAYLETRPSGQVFAVRTLTEFDEDDFVLHTEISSPPEYDELVATWGDRGLGVNCVTASCFQEPDWQDAWSPSLRAWPTVVLADVGFAAMIGPAHLLGDEQHVDAASIGIGHPSLKALVMHVDGHPHVLLSIADDLTIQLLHGQLVDLLGERLAADKADWTAWLPALSSVTATVLGTESALRYSTR